MKASVVDKHINATVDLGGFRHNLPHSVVVPNVSGVGCRLATSGFDLTRNDVCRIKIKIDHPRVRAVTAKRLAKRSSKASATAVDNYVSSCSTGHLPSEVQGLGWKRDPVWSRNVSRCSRQCQRKLV
jgi:hypothetical protein